MASCLLLKTIYEMVYGIVHFPGFFKASGKIQALSKPWIFFIKFKAFKALYELWLYYLNKTNKIKRKKRK